MGWGLGIWFKSANLCKGWVRWEKVVVLFEPRLLSKVNYTFSRVSFGSNNGMHDEGKFREGDF